VACQLNRITHAARQPGSAIKPLTYLAALGKGLQPNPLKNVSAAIRSSHAIHVRA
jgi:membrane carboxypeptidase/penicillin-binding protein